MDGKILGLLSFAIHHFAMCHFLPPNSKQRNPQSRVSAKEQNSYPEGTRSGFFVRSCP